MPRELRVPDLVGPRTEVARHLDPSEEVRVPLPAAVYEDGLVDHVRAGAHRLQRCGRAALKPFSVREVVDVVEDVDDAEPVAIFAEVFEEPLLVLDAALCDAVEDGVLLARRLQVALGDRAVQVGEVATLDEPDEVRGRVDQAAIDQLHADLDPGERCTSPVVYPAPGTASPRGCRTDAVAT